MGLPPRAVRPCQVERPIRATEMLRFIAVFVGLSVIFLIPFLIWGDLFDAALTREGSISWIESFGPLGWQAGIGLLVSDLVIPIPSTIIMSALGYLYGAVLGGLLATLEILSLRTAGLLSVPVLRHSSGSTPGWRRATWRDGNNLSANGGMAGGAFEVAAPFSRGGRVHGWTRKNAFSGLSGGSCMRFAATGVCFRVDWFSGSLKPLLGAGAECGPAAAPLAGGAQAAVSVEAVLGSGIPTWNVERRSYSGSFGSSTL